MKFFQIDRLSALTVRNGDAGADDHALVADHVPEVVAVAALDLLVLVLVDRAVQQEVGGLGAAGARAHHLLGDLERLERDR